MRPLVLEVCRMAGTLVSVAPVMALFLFLQRESSEGLMADASKG